MRRQNIRKRRQRLARGQQDSGAHDSVPPIAQFVHDRANPLPSESCGGGKAIREMFLRGGKVQRLREVVRLLCPRSTGSNDNQLAPFHNLQGTCDLGHRDHGSPARMHSDTDGYPLQDQKVHQTCWARILSQGDHLVLVANRFCWGSYFHLLPNSWRLRFGLTDLKIGHYKSVIICAPRWDKSVRKNDRNMLSIELLRDGRFLAVGSTRETRLRPKKMRAF
jgi:hypothetical protein